MADLIKKIKIKKQDGTFTDYIPIGAEAQNVSTSDGDSVQLKLNKKPYYYNSVADMKADIKLKAGDMVITLGYYEIGDGGGAEYLIVDDDLIEDNGSVHELNNELYAVLLIKEHTVNVKQFGAHGDEETDDTTFIQNAINSSATIIDFLDKKYMINDKMTFKSKTYIGNKATLILGDQITTREHVIRNEHYNQFTYMDDITMKNLVVINNSNETAFGFSCSRVVIEHCDFYGYKLSTHGTVNLFANNSNSIIKDCYFKVEVSDPEERGGAISIRGFYGGITKNVLVSNCYVESNALDELLWINAGKCPLEDIVVENCVFKETGLAQDVIFISNSTSTGNTTHIDNVIFKNNTIIQDTLASRTFTIGRDEHNDYVELIDTRNIFLENNTIIINHSEEHGRIIVFGYDDSEPELTLRNNTFIYKGTDELEKIEYALVGRMKCYNNTFKIKGAKYVYLHAYEVDGDIITNCDYLGRNLNIIKNVKATCGTSVINDTPDKQFYASTKIIDSNLSCTYLLTNASGNVGRIYEVSNNIINNSSHVYNNYGGDNTNVLKLNNNILTTTNIVNNIACTLYLGINYKSDGTMLSGIPSQSTTRGSCVVGTVLFSNTPTKAIVRKITSGDATTDWEEV